MEEIKNKEILEDEYLIFDTVFMDIDLEDIPIEKLRKQYVDFKDIVKNNDGE